MSSSPYRCRFCAAHFFVSSLLNRHEAHLCPKKALDLETEVLLVGHPEQPIRAYRKRLRVSLTHRIPLCPDSEPHAARKIPRALPTSALAISPSSDLIRSSVPPCQPICNESSSSREYPNSSRAANIPNDSQSSANNEEREISVEVNTVDQPLAVRRSRRANLKPISDIHPEPLAKNRHVPRLEDNLLLARHISQRNSREKPRYIPGPTNSFGLTRRYYGTSLPTHDPEEYLDLEDLYDSPYHLDAEMSLSSPFGPFPNLSSFELGEWYINSGTRFLIKNLERLVDIAQTPDFAANISRTNWSKVFDILATHREQLEGAEHYQDHWVDDDGWKETPVSISVPFVSQPAEERVVGTLLHRSIVAIVHQKIANSDAKLFHYEPFELSWQPNPATPPMRVRSELYNSDAFIEAHRELQDSPPIPGCTRPRVVVGLMLWSDATHVTSFSSEKLWPIYMAFANESKYERCKPTSNLTHQIAYLDEASVPPHALVTALVAHIHQLSDEFIDYATQHATGQGHGKMQKQFMAFCRTEMFHGQWVIILDDELLAAIKDGIVIKCSDGIERRFYIRIFTYSADYPEKQKGDCPCPRCLVAAKKLDQTGKPEDTVLREYMERRDDESRIDLVEQARQKIHTGAALANNQVEALMKPQSLKAISNAFSKLRFAKFDIFAALTVDLLHEFEIGAWKALLIHLLRILDACGPNMVLLHLFDKRFRLVPTFGKAVRRFSTNVSGLKKAAARDYEDILQCVIPVIESLIPDEHVAKGVMAILLICVRWHALAKLRMHTDATLQLLDDATKELGDGFRLFVDDVCTRVSTKELRVEAEARERRERRKEEARAAKAAGEIERDQTAEMFVRLAEAGEASNTTGSTTSGEARTDGTRAPVKTTPGSLPSQPPTSAYPSNMGAQEREGPGGALVGASAPTPLPNLGDAIPPSQTLANKKQAGKAAFSSKAKSTQQKRVTLNIKTVKFHFLGDYVQHIRRFGTTDNYSTELGELLHRFPKGWYKRSSKRKPRKEVTCYERKTDHMRRLRRKIEARKKASTRDVEEQKAAARTPDIHHFIGSTQKTPVSLASFSIAGGSDNSVQTRDPLAQSFLPNLQEHLLPRVIACVRAKRRELLDEDGLQCDVYPHLSSFDPSFIAFKDHRIFAHKIMRIKYTAYDVRRGEDAIHVDSDVCNIMVLNPQYHEDPTAPPYLYARVLGIYHGNASYTGQIAPGGVRQLTYNRYEFLWVRWYSRLSRTSDDTKTIDADCVAFLPITSPGATSFIDPSAVLRASHIIPRFAKDKVHADGQGLSAMGKDGSDWRQYYVNRYVDRDMFMRYQIGMAVGHTGVWPTRMCFQTPVPASTPNDPAASNGQGNIIPSLPPASPISAGIPNDPKVASAQRSVPIPSLPPACISYSAGDQDILPEEGGIEQEKEDDIWGGGSESEGDSDREDGGLGSDAKSEVDDDEEDEEERLARMARNIEMLGPDFV